MAAPARNEKNCLQKISKSKIFILPLTCCSLANARQPVSPFFPINPWVRLCTRVVWLGSVEKPSVQIQKSVQISHFVKEVSRLEFHENPESRPLRPAFLSEISKLADATPRACTPTGQLSKEVLLGERQQSQVHDFHDVTKSKLNFDARVARANFEHLNRKPSRPRQSNRFR